MSSLSKLEFHSQVRTTYLFQNRAAEDFYQNTRARERRWLMRILRFLLATTNGTSSLVLSQYHVPESSQSFIFSPEEIIGRLSPHSNLRPSVWIARLARYLEMILAFTFPNRESTFDFITHPTALDFTIFLFLFLISLLTLQSLNYHRPAPPHPYPSSTTFKVLVFLFACLMVGLEFAGRSGVIDILILGNYIPFCIFLGMIFKGSDRWIYSAKGKYGTVLEKNEVAGDRRESA